MHNTQNSDNGYAIELQEVINFLESNNYSALPVAPAQDPREYPKVVKADEEKGYWKHCPLTDELKPTPLYTGKNPSWLDQNDIPHLVFHKQYQNRLPSEREKKKWFANRKNGIGTLGGLNNTVWVDFDTKQFSSQEECDAAVLKILEEHPELQQTFIERTHSGGWRVGVRVKEEPTFTNFALTPGGKHIGEALGEGRFTVLASTVGPSGNPYQSINRVVPVEVMSLESIGIYPTSTKTKNKAQKNPQPLFSTPSSYTPGSIPLEQLGNDTSREILNGANPKDNRSESLATAIQEWYGWQNFADENGILTSGSTRELAHYAGGQLGIDSDRIDRIINGIDSVSCNPAALNRGGEESCWKKIRRLDKPTFEAKCPTQIKEAIRLESRQYQSTVTREATTGRIVTDQSSPNVVSGNFGGSGSGGNGSGGSSGSGSGGSGGNGGSDTPEGYIYKLVEDLVNKRLNPAQKSAALLDLSTLTKLPLSGLKEIAREIEKELDFAADLENDQEELNELLKYQKKKLDLEKIHPKLLAQALLNKSESDRLDPLYMHMNVLSAVGAKLGAQIGMMGKQGASLSNSWVEFAIMFVTIIAIASNGKSQAQLAIFRPITDKQNSARKRFKDDIKKLDKLKAEWQAKSSKDKEAAKDTLQNPQKFEENIVRPSLQVIESGTPEAIFKNISKNPPKSGTVFVLDEILQIMSLDQYKQGKGDSRQRILKSWSRPLTGEELRADDRDSILFEHQTFGINGNIQPNKVQEFFSDPDDADGFASRFLVGEAETPDNFDVWSDDTVRIHEFLEKIYEDLDHLPNKLRKLAKLPELDKDNNPTTVVLKFSPEAFKSWREWWQKIRRLQRKMETENPAFSGYLGKALSQFLRLVLIIHCLSVVCGEESNPLEVSQKTFERALYAIQWHIGQFRLLQSRTSHDLSGTLLKVYKYAERKGIEISAEKIQKTIFRRGERKPKLPEIRKMMEQLAAWGKATIIGTGTKMRLLVNKIKDVVIPTNSDKNYDNPQKAESPTDSSVEESKKENYDNYDNSSTPEFPEETTPAVVESEYKEVVLSQPDTQEPEDLITEDCRNCRKEEEEEDSTPVVEPLPEDSEMSENQSEMSRNYDNNSETEAEPDNEPENEPENDPDDDPDPDNDPPASALEPNELTDEEAPKGKGQILWAANFINPSSPNQQQEDQEWKDEENLKEMAKELARCKSIEELQVLRLCWRNREALNAAAKMLTPEQHSKINKWVIELNKTHPLFQIGDSCTYSGNEIGLQKVCKKHKLEIVAIEGDVATVACSEWNPSVTNVIPLADLKLIR